MKHPNRKTNRAQNVIYTLMSKRGGGAGLSRRFKNILSTNAPVRNSSRTRCELRNDAGAVRDVSDAPERRRLSRPVNYHMIREYLAHPARIPGRRRVRLRGSWRRLRVGFFKYCVSKAGLTKIAGALVATPKFAKRVPRCFFGEKMMDF